MGRAGIAAGFRGAGLGAGFAPDLRAAARRFAASISASRPLTPRSVKARRFGCGGSGAGAADARRPAVAWSSRAVGRPSAARFFGGGGDGALLAGLRAGLLAGLFFGAARRGGLAGSGVAGGVGARSS